MNQITVTGNVVHTPEMRTTQSGMTCCNFSVAVKRKFKNKTTQTYETDFFDVTAWGNLGNICQMYIEKGKKVLVVGEMQSRDYEGRDGTKKRAWTINADTVEFLSQKPQNEAAPPSPAAAAGFTSIQVDDDELPF